VTTEVLLYHLRVCSTRLGLTLGLAALCLVVARAIAADPSPICFEDVAHQAGLGFTLRQDPTPAKHMIETMPGGIAVFDYDNDGLPDVYFTNGASTASLRKDKPEYANRLFHNEGGLRFRDVTKEAGVAGEGYSMGAAAGDFDNDGRVDLFVAGVQRNTLFRNLGTGRFEEVTAKSGIGSTEWSVAAAWLDFDNDGRLDLVVTNYGKWSAASEPFCGDRTRGVRVYCHPKYYEPRPNQLYRNRGDGTFEDVSQSSGIAAHRGRGMSVAIADYDRDGRIDFFIPNDNLPNFLFHNEGKGKFSEVALLSGVALLDSGKPIASMGADFRDYDNDGLPDVFVVALTGETFPVFRNQGKGLFNDVTHKSRMAQLSNRYAGWGTLLADFNNDGWKDLFTSNSHVNDIVEQFEPTTYKQSNTVFVNQKNGQFAASSCEALSSRMRAHRGLAEADFDGDGKLDVVVSALGEPAELWRNVSGGSNHWLVVKLEGTRSNRDGIGAVVRIGDQVNEVTAAQGYASPSLSGVHFGLGELTRAPVVEVRWPSGIVQVVKDVAADQVLKLREPSSKPGNP
jgi:hypothetical protein